MIARSTVTVGWFMEQFDKSWVASGIICTHNNDKDTWRLWPELNLDICPT